MKNLIKGLWIFSLTIIFMTSCSNQDDGSGNDKPNYEFENEDFPFLLEHYNTVNQRLVFKNEEKQEFSFKLKQFEDSNESYIVTGGLGPPSSSLIFNYDVRTINFEFEQYNQPNGDLHILFNKFSDTLRGSINFPLWNTNEFNLNSEKINFDQQTIVLNINGTTFFDVIKIESGETIIDFEIGPFTKNVNILYYDLKKGLVGFDDLNGGEWRLIE
ncbi:MAG: hypothetical protein CMC13_00410 [Flavobacteriaceae bacterium]|nr:hypothetical protein [Flavobacteriaceae bacterium]|tara:strand:+ start:48 stop:692 length:645 start_codon:yes stop_codon:yes gene_type:complete